MKNENTSSVITFCQNIYEVKISQNLISKIFFFSCSKSGNFVVKSTISEHGTVTKEDVQNDGLSAPFTSFWKIASFQITTLEILLCVPKLSISYKIFRIESLTRYLSTSIASFCVVWWQIKISWLRSHGGAQCSEGSKNV